MPAPRPANPTFSGTLHLSGALDSNESLTRLLQRLHESRACFDTVAPLLPESMRETLRPGPIDEQGWSLLAPNGACAAKLRQLAPSLLERLRAQGHPVAAIRVRIQAR